MKFFKWTIIILVILFIMKGCLTPSASSTNWKGFNDCMERGGISPDGCMYMNRN